MDVKSFYLTEQDKPVYKEAKAKYEKQGFSSLSKFIWHCVWYYLNDIKTGRINGNTTNTKEG